MQSIKNNKLAKAISKKLAYNTQEVLEEMQEEGQQYVKPEELYARKCIKAIEKDIKDGYIFKKDNEIYPLINQELNTFNEKLQKDENEFNKFKEFLKTTYMNVLKKRFSKKDIIDINDSREVSSMADNAMFMYLKGGNETWANKKVKLNKKADYHFIDRKEEEIIANLEQAIKEAISYYKEQWMLSENEGDREHFKNIVNYLNNFQNVRTSSKLKTLSKKAAYPFYEMVKDNSPLYQPNDPIGVQSGDNDLNVNFKGVNFDTDFEQAGYFNQYGLNNVDEKELEKGIKVEMEHTTNKEIAKRIALDHLTEISNYYTLLAEMEDKAKKMGTFNNNIKGEGNE